MLSTTQVECRVNPIPPSKWKAEWATILGGLPGDSLKGKYYPYNVMGTIAYQKDLFSHFMKYWVASKTALHLTVRAQEMIILRMAVLNDCDYVWGHHVPVALEGGLSRMEINSLLYDIKASDWSSREFILLSIVDEMYLSKKLTNESWERAKQFFDEHQILDIITIISQYVYFSLVNNVFQVELEEAIEPIPSTIGS